MRSKAIWIAAFVSLCNLWAPRAADSVRADGQPYQAPPPNPPVELPSEQNSVSGATELGIAAPAAAPSVEWTMHKSADGSDPSGAEQEMMWYMNRARANPSAEGLWLATSNDPAIAGGRSFFNVNLTALQDAFDLLPVEPPAAFDIRLHDASELHSLDLIARDSQDHTGQSDRVNASGFACNGSRLSVFSYATSALNAHAALNIDWGNAPDGMQDPPGHRQAIMGVWPFAGPGLTNVGLAIVPENNQSTQVGPLVFSGAYCQAGAPDNNRFIVGTVWDDSNADGDYDAGEGLGGVLVMPDDGTYYAITGDAGGYAIPIEAAGTFQVQFSGGQLPGGPYFRQAVVGAESVQLDLLLSDVIQDSDGDGVPDADDDFPNDPSETTDTDGDGIGNNADLDDDGDGVPDVSDDYPLGRFADAGPGYWAFQFVETLARAGVTGGCGGDNYCPEDRVTRAQMAVFLERGMRGAGYSPPAATGTRFNDVGASDFAAAFIEQLATDGITGGCGNNNYCPNDNVTRAQMAVFLLRAMFGPGFVPSPATGVFADVAPPDFAAAFIERLAAEGITSGCGNGNYCPSDPVTRAQMAVFLVRAFGL